MSKISAHYRGNKGYLPSKICPTCQRPFTWRKKWQRDWENVRYCSQRCRQRAKSARALPHTQK